MSTDKEESGSQDIEPPIDNWDVIDKSILLQLIRTGINTHFVAIQEAFVQTTSNLIIARFSKLSNSNFSIGDDQCRQIALFVLDPGINGAQGTRRKVEELLRSIPFDSLSKYPEFSELSGNRKLQTEDETCIYCQ